MFHFILSQWLLGSMFDEDKRNFVGDLICFIIVTPLAGISAFLCISGATFYLKRSLREPEEDQRLEGVGLAFLAAFLILLYFLWLGLTLRYNCQMYSTWRATNQDVKLVEVTVQDCNGNVIDEKEKSTTKL